MALGANTATAGSVVIKEVFVNVDATRIWILGEGWEGLGTYPDPEPEVTLGTFGALVLVSVYHDVIEARLPPDIPVGGQYLLLVTVPPTASSADGCDDGKPMALTFEYTGLFCGGNNPQGGKFECIDVNTWSGGPVGIRITKDAGKTDVVPSDEPIEQYESVTFIATGKRLKSKTRFDVVEGGLVLQSLNIHTSCSKPLEVGNVFGSMTLTGFFPEGTDESELRPSSDEFDMVIPFFE